ncbi:DUF4129 domain-containing protein [Hazenella sp. IB182357]|uniref:DUF4129 domain-containing protein n=1 Tax=Polycladospora coralii TaxID=2771432 RepID=A0A926N8W3_9BACL|nr:DUF4129 domain-containing protein [Polycladospora coralii]MBD1371517.1 DUF4129 domain-containing protein [Polycladospora coralii]MBS7528983.1 DUF4129 domain-containing protein [Polycladospora coralii]
MPHTNERESGFLESLDLSEVGTIMWSILGILIIAFLVWLVTRWWFTRQEWKDTSDKQVHRDTDWRAQALTYVKEGKYNLGVMAWFKWSLTFLANEQKLNLKSNKTNGDYRKELKNSWPEKSTSFSAITAQFERVKYGESPVNEQEYAAYSHHLDALTEKEGPDETGR